MTNNFFITGLPRTRTAWLSCFFTSNNVFCYHEILRYIKKEEGIDKVISKLTNRKEMYVGNSDSSMPIWGEKIHDIVKDSPVVVIERDEKEVIESLTDIFGHQEHMEYHIKEASDRLKVIKEKYNCISVHFYDLDDSSYVKSIWEHCVPKLPFDMDRFNQLNVTDIIVDKNRYLEGIEDCALFWELKDIGGIVDETEEEYEG